MSALKAAIIPVTPLQQNCAILWDDATKQAAAVDPGGDVDRILEAIEKLGVQAVKILLTHGHIDRWWRRYAEGGAQGHHYGGRRPW